MRMAFVIRLARCRAQGSYMVMLPLALRALTSSCETGREGATEAIAGAGWGGEGGDQQGRREAFGPPAQDRGELSGGVSGGDYDSGFPLLFAKFTFDFFILRVQLRSPVCRPLGFSGSGESQAVL